MSEEAKKNLRTQGKYSSDKPFHKNRDKRPKESPGEREQPEKKSQKRNSDGYKQNTSYDESENESAVKYQANSSHSFSELEDDKKPVEICDRGEYVISETINGKSIVLYEPEFIDVEDADYFLSALDDSTQWNEKNIIIRGVEYPQPRLVAWYGPFPYSYSGVTLESKEMPENILRIKRYIEDYLVTKQIDATFNSVLLNCYRNGKDSVAWHSDDELTMGICPTIASVSLGESRKFEMRRKIKSYEEEVDDSQTDKYYVNLTHGSLLIMNGSMQEDWQHRIPKEYHDKGRRINLTFRIVYQLDKVPPEIPTKEYKNSQVSSKAWDTSPSCEINYDKNFPPLGHSIATSDDKNFPPLGHSVATSDDKNFPPLGHSVATSSKMDIEHETSDHEMDIENKDISLPNNTSMNSAYSNVESNISSNFKSCIVSYTTPENKDISLPNNTSMNSAYSNVESNIGSNFRSCIVSYTTENEDISLPNNTSMNSAYSNVESSISSHFESSIVSYTTSEGYDNSTEYFDDNSQNLNTYVGSNMNNLNDDKQNIKHELNKNVNAFDNSLNDSDSMNPDEESIGHDESCTNSSSMDKRRFSNSQESPVSNSKEITPFSQNICRSVPPFGQNINSNLNAFAKEFVPGAKSSPVSEERTGDHVSLEKLLTYDVEEMENEDFIDYAYELKDRILREIREFGIAKDELYVLCDLMEDKLPLSCQKKITARMCEIVKKNYRKAQNNDKFNTKNFRHTRPENQEYGSSSRGRGYQEGRNAMRRPESSARENFSREEEYSRRGDFGRGYPEKRRECFERGNSNREDNSKRGPLNRDEYSGGERRMTSRDGRYPSNRFGRGNSHRGIEFRNRRAKHTD